MTLGVVHRLLYHYSFGAKPIISITTSSLTDVMFEISAYLSWYTAFPGKTFYQTKTLAALSVVVQLQLILFWLPHMYQEEQLLVPVQNVSSFSVNYWRSVNGLHRWGTS